MKSSWRRETLKSACDVIAGQSPAGSAYNSAAHGLPFYQGKKEFTEKFIGPPTTWTTETTKVALAGDILLSVRAPVGPINFSLERICIGRGLAALRAKPDVDRDFLFYYLLHYKDRLVGKDGAVFPSISKAEIERIPISLPSLTEQKRIVGVLDEAFESIAVAKANTKSNILKSRELLENELQAIFSSHAIGWVERTLGEVCHQITDGKHGDCRNDGGSGYYFLSAKDIREGTLNYTGARQIAKRDFEETHRRTRLEPGDILVTNSGTIGRVAIAPNHPNTARTTFQKSVAILKPTPSLLDSTFAYYCLSSGLSRFVALSAGTAQKNLLLRDLRSFRFRLPESIDEQRAVARRLQQLSGSTKALEACYKRKNALLEELTTSLLHAAFNGKL